jgi:hypothetical protein
MSIYTLRSGASFHPETSVLQYYTDTTFTSGVVGASDFNVTQLGTPNMSVNVAVGRAYAVSVSLATNCYPIRSTAVENVLVGSNSSGNPRIDAVVLYIDLSAPPVSDGTGVAKLDIIQGTPAPSPVAPVDATIWTQIGASNPFMRLAHVTVASGATSILTANISDQRARAKMYPPNLFTSLLTDSIILDEDTMASDSAVALPTQQSVKSYVNSFQTTATTSPITPTGDRRFNDSFITSLANALTINAPSGTPANGNRLIIRILDNGTARAISWNGIFQSRCAVLPTTTVISKYLYIGLIYNSTAVKWDCMVVSNEA